MKKSHIALCIAATLNFGCSASAQTPPSHANPDISFKQQVEAILKATGVPGASVAVIKDFAVVDAFGVGVRAVDVEDPQVTVDTPFQAASISKVLAATATMQLIELEDLSLDTKVNQRLKYWHIPPHPWFNESPVTVEELLSHTAGITVSGFSGYQAGDTLPTVDTILDGIPPANSNAVVVYRKPGNRFRYSGGGYTVLQRLLMDVRGANFSNLMLNTLFDPLKMERSTFRMCLAEHCTHQVAWGHQVSNGKATLVSGEFYDYPEKAAAGLWSTGKDLATFVLDIQKSLRDDSGTILNQASAQTMTTRTVETDLFSGGAAWEGVGVFLCNTGKDGSDASKDNYFFHPGQNTGYLSQFFAHKSGGYGLVVLSNGDSVEFINEVTRAAAQRYGWESGYQNCEFSTEHYHRLFRIPRRDPW